ncbi:eukaryotic translation initiation factor 2-alpha kinase 3-like [Paramacrobiotus metropolitanus]|uniref:eukaryotic translation initiation factor 2-alpha kinase 3-like n=1 Tax=Paramacrobiotus metropolitanus TaxID=2943436 RepID=UPI002445A357|nr:eukaryotic translation initiation factor 2-alpha kinase 3-like [Paramacrobiotus metropolitanus]
MIEIDLEKLLRVGVVIAIGVSVISAVHLALESDVPRTETTVLVSRDERRENAAENDNRSVLASAGSADHRPVADVILDGKMDEEKTLVEDKTAKAVVVKPDAKKSSDVEGDSVLLIGGIDGSLTAFSSNVEAEVDAAQIRPLWTFHSNTGPLVSSSLSKIELVKNGLPIQLIPSLDGSLFSFDGQTIEPLPVSADTLLSSSFKISEDSVVTGGKETVVYGLNPSTGKVKYTCGVGGCVSQSAEVPQPSSDADSGTLLISRLSQSIRAFDVHSGGEKWNFSVGSLEVAMAAGGTSRFQGNVRVCEVGDDVVLSDRKSAQFRFDVANGRIVAYSQGDDKELWQYQMKHPITSAFLMENGCVRPLNLVTEVPPYRDPLLSQGESNQLIYVGFYENQLYIQRAGSVADMPMRQKFPQVTFRPLLINAPSRTPAISDAYSPFLGSALAKPSANDKALMPIGPNEYPFDGGYFVAFPDRTTKDSPVSLPGNGGEKPPNHSMLEQIMRRWQTITGLFLLPLVVTVMLRRHYKQKIFQLQSESDLLKRQNTTSSSGTLTSVISMQETQPKHSRFRSDFEVIEKLGKGGFGVVYTARNRLDDNLYAVKKIGLPKSDAAREKVRREVRVLAKLDHVGIIRFYNAWVETSDPESDLPDTDMDEDPHNRGDHPTCEPTSISSATSADLNCLYIGTQRKKRSFVEVGVPLSGNELTDSLRFVPDSGDGNEGEASVVFEADSGVPEKSEAEQMGVLEMAATEVMDSQSDGIVFEEPPGAGVVEKSKRRRSRSSTKKSTPSLSGMSELEESEAAGDETDGAGKLGRKKILSKPQLFIQMELCRKETLKDWLKSNVERRIRNHVLDIYYQIVSAVEYVHAKGLMHRDLKPSNILFSLDGRAVKVGDFGLVTSLDDEERLRSVVPMVEEKNYLSIHSHTNQVGTSLYMSPELVQGKNYDEKVDMYSLGLILFELLVPFQTEMERMYCMRAAKNLQLDDLKSPAACSYPGDEPWLRRLLAPQPSQRPSAVVLRSCDLFRDLLVMMESGGGHRHRGHSVSLADFFPEKK